MTFPIWMLLAFAIWTVFILFFTVGIYRWSRILTGKVPIKDFRADSVQGEDWYLRAMRAHANCVENLPIFSVVVFALYVSGVTSGMANILAATVLVARIIQSTIHVCFTQTNTISSLRFIFFLVQIISFIYMAALVVIQAL